MIPEPMHSAGVDNRGIYIFRIALIWKSCSREVVWVTKLLEYSKLAQ